MIRKLWTIYRSTSIFARFAAVTVLIFVAFVGISIHNYLQQKQLDENSLYSVADQTNQQLTNDIDIFLNDLSNITKQPLTYTRDDISYMNRLSEFNQTNIANRNFQVMNEAIFEAIMTYKPSVDSCFIYNSKGRCDYKTRTPIFWTPSPLNDEWFLKTIERFGKSMVIDTYEFPYTAYRKEPLYVFGLARGILQIESSSIIGVLLVNVPTSYFDELFSSLRISDVNRLVLLHDDYVIYDSVTENITQRADKALSAIDWEHSSSFVPVTLDGVKYLAASAISEVSGWRLVSLYSEEDLFSDLRASELQNMLLTLLLGVLALLCMFFTTQHIIVPIRQLSSHMKQVSSGDFDTRIKVNYHDETGQLMESFNSMTSHIQHLINTVYLEQLTQSKLEMQMLQAQINPHFLYNTLESISMMAVINDDDTTSDMAQNLGSILRYSISAYSEEVTVRDEIVSLKKYIALQDVRFSSQYRISVDVDESYFAIPTIKMILQPIVENAIYHGMSSIRHYGNIHIAAQKKGNVLTFTVADNGNGMSPEKVQELNDYINDKNNAYKSIGLRNVNKRIKLRYGDAFGVVITSEEGVGTTVYISIGVTGFSAGSSKE